MPTVMSMVPRHGCTVLFLRKTVIVTVLAPFTLARRSTASPPHSDESPGPDCVRLVVSTGWLFWLMKMLNGVCVFC